MKDIDLAKMSVDELWNLHEQLREILATKLDDEMHEVQRRMAEIDAKTRRALSEGAPKIPESGAALRNLVRTRLATALGTLAATQGKEVRRPADLPVTLSNARPDLSLRGLVVALE